MTKKEIATVSREDTSKYYIEFGCKMLKVKYQSSQTISRIRNISTYQVKRVKLYCYNPPLTVMIGYAKAICDRMWLYLSDDERQFVLAD